MYVFFSLKHGGGFQQKWLFGTFISEIWEKKCRTWLTLPPSSLSRRFDFRRTQENTFQLKESWVS
ncbi:hypothetical protein H4Q32_030072 [Labeo rohita]|uniref:Uncharacterized protein n=1 Tax=Labeo rohita TaxID=84645 RepID=A0ABQ8MGR5_LABRO|nr:hypothetical protein H4Q32_030072 [Labeo rohita]